jgi:hypothetical protein
VLPPDKNLAVLIGGGGVYMGVSESLLSVSLVVIDGIEKTPPAERGHETEGLLKGSIDSFEVLFDEGPQSWYAKQSILVEAGMPVVVFGEPFSQSLAIFKESGPAEIVELSSTRSWNSKES